jgi:hypothetical protein
MKVEVLDAIDAKGPPKQAEFDRIRQLADKIAEKLA